MWLPPSLEERSLPVGGLGVGKDLDGHFFFSLVFWPEWFLPTLPSKCLILCTFVVSAMKRSSGVLQTHLVRQEGVRLCFCK